MPDDCAAARAQAASFCSFCHGPIGYETPFYSQIDALIHADCLEGEHPRP